MSTETTPQSQERKELRGLRIGTVIGDKASKTRRVQVSYQVRHPKYGKYLKRDTTYYVHDEKNESKAGDRVEIAPCRPISKTKSWRLVRIVEASIGEVTV